MFMMSQDNDEDVTNEPIDFTPALRFVPPSTEDTPNTLFSLRHRVGVTGERFTRRSNEREILIYTDGSCLNNGQTGAVGGCAFVFKGASPSAPQRGIVSFRLEDRGPSGVIYPHTSNRAELRAVIAALQFRVWHGEGYNQLVIATLVLELTQLQCEMPQEQPVHKTLPAGSDLNKPYITIANLIRSRTVTLTVNNVGAAAGTYQVSLDLVFPGQSVTINPASFTARQNETVPLFITVTATTSTTNLHFWIKFFKGGQGHYLHIPLAVSPNSAVR